MLFTKIMKFRILELVNENYDDIHPTTRSVEANKRVSAAWERITNSMNNEFPDNIVTSKQIKECFKYLKKISRDQITRVYNYCDEQRNVKKEIDDTSSSSKSPDNPMANGMLENILCRLPGVISNINDDVNKNQSNSCISPKNCSTTQVDLNGSSSDQFLSSRKRPCNLLNQNSDISKKPKIDDFEENNLLDLQKSLLEAKLEFIKKKTETLEKINKFYENGELFFKAGIKFFENKNK
ncbi:hypothetical protein ACQ4LE_008291 [Meloidogyne hapla]|uniref:Regulatory protein zeste n=1 Tax=Meloidogyne hapla TaxID=6305 RepID=A0A1I8B1F3_MELHA